MTGSLRNLLLLLAMLAVVTGDASLSRADVSLTGTSRCVDGEDLRAGLAAIVAKARPDGGADLLVRVDLGEREKVTWLALSIELPDGSPGLERSYELGPGDCASGAALLLTVTAAFLEDLPVMRWTAPQTPEPAPEPTPTVAPAAPRPAILPTTSAARRPIYLLTAATALALDISNNRLLAIPTAQIGAAVALDVSENLMGLGGVVRGSPGHDLGPGRFHSIGLLAEFSWQRGHKIVIAGQLRAGAVRVAGSDFAESFSTWLPWVEGGASLGYRWRSIELFASLSASPLRHRVVTQDRSHSELLPRRGIGLGVKYLLGDKKP